MSTSDSSKKPAPFSLVIFGASGDLTSRKLVPALFGLHKEGLLPDQFEIIGFARREKSDDSFRDEMLAGAQKFSRFAPIDENEWKDFAQHIVYHQGNFDDSQAYQSLADRINKNNSEHGLTEHLFYLSTAPSFFGMVARALSEVKLVGYNIPGRIVVEKPFGHDHSSAEALVVELQNCLDEKSIYRIDHYLGKETVQNLLYFRFANSIYEPIWHRNFIDHIQITVAEKEGVGTRGGYYDGVGALRDMVQNHLMQLLAITAMEPPGSLHSEAIRDEKVKVLRSIPTPHSTTLSENVVRAQYEGYRQSDRVDPESMTETYVAMKLMIDNWRWAGVPFYLRTGKSLATRASEIVVVFKRPPKTLFGETSNKTVQRNRLHIRLQPNEGIHLTFNAKRPGKSEVEFVDMDFAYSSKFGSYSPEAYERLLHDFIVGDSTLFTRADEVLLAWEIIDAIRHGWNDLPMGLYRLGSWGPSEADAMLMNKNNSWIPLVPRVQ
ncbi:MAG: glucose-6-phosphate dehydrogenase [Verrucomicrobiota bacterium]